MSAISQVVQAFGFHWDSTLTVEDTVKFRHIERLTGNNLGNAAAVLPLVGNVIGVLRIIHFAEVSVFNTQIRPYAVTQIVRGVLETLFLGIVLLLVDLIVTLGRYIAYKCDAYQVPNQLRNPNQANGLPVN